MCDVESGSEELWAENETELWYVVAMKKFRGSKGPPS